MIGISLTIQARHIDARRFVYSTARTNYEVNWIIYMNLKINKMLEQIKLKLIKLLINSTFKYNKSECREKWLETTIDDIKFLIEE
jgi:hypothetical protein